MEHNNEERFEDLFSEFIAFALPTFAEATTESSIEKLKDEAKEASNAMYLFEGRDNVVRELCDCLMCILDAYARLVRNTPSMEGTKLNFDELKKVFRFVLDRNKSRDWKMNPNKTYSHVKRVVNERY